MPQRQLPVARRRRARRCGAAPQRHLKAAQRRTSGVVAPRRNAAAPLARRRCGAAPLSWEAPALRRSAAVPACCYTRKTRQLFNAHKGNTIELLLQTEALTTYAMSMSTLASADNPTHAWSQHKSHLLYSISGRPQQIRKDMTKLYPIAFRY